MRTLRGWCLVGSTACRIWQRSRASLRADLARRPPTIHVTPAALTEQLQAAMVLWGSCGAACTIRAAGSQRGRLADAGERARLAAIAAGVQPDDQSVPDRDNVICPVVGLPVPVRIDPRCSHHQHHPIA
jgi:hypothetical protein